MLGALGIILKLGLWDTIAIIVLSNLVGCGIFGAFTDGGELRVGHVDMAADREQALGDGQIANASARRRKSSAGMAGGSRPRS